MDIDRIPNSKVLSIEVKSGVDEKGVDTYSKKSFSNLRHDANEQNVYDVADAIKAILAEPTRAYFINSSFELANA